jgi:predicted DNA-binding protein
MRKPRDDKYRKTHSKDGTFSCRVNPEVNELLDYYCEKRNINKKDYCNEAIREKLEKDMQETKVYVSMMYQYEHERREKQNSNKYEQMGIPGIE